MHCFATPGSWRSCRRSDCASDGASAPPETPGKQWLTVIKPDLFSFFSRQIPVAERSWNSHVKSIWTPSNSRVTSYSQSHDGILPGTHWILIVGGLRNTSNCGLPGQVQWSRRATWYKGAAASMHYVTKESNKNRRTPHPVPIPSPNDCISHISFSGSGCSHYAHEGLSRFGVPRLRFETENYTFLQTCLTNTASKDDQIWYLHISFANCSYNDPILSRETLNMF